MPACTQAFALTKVAFQLAFGFLCRSDRVTCCQNNGCSKRLCQPVFQNKPAAAGPGRWPVGIVGAGPTGLTLSILLTKLGVNHVLLEKDTKVTEHPQVIIRMVLWHLTYLA